MNYLIDTNIISEVRKGARCDPHVAAWYASIAGSEIYLSVIVLGEIRRGVERERRSDRDKADILEAWLLAVQAAFAGRILPIDEAVADEWGRISAGRPVAGPDGLLAATAKVHGMTLVTRNIDDVGDLGALTLNPFRFAARASR